MIGRLAMGVTSPPLLFVLPRPCPPRLRPFVPSRRGPQAAGAVMAEAVERTDELVREYLLFRGFTHTLRQLDAEIKADREKGFRVRGWAGGGPRWTGAGLLLPLLPPSATSGSMAAVSPSPALDREAEARHAHDCLELLREAGALKPSALS